MKINLDAINKDILSLEGPVLSIYLKTDPTSENWKIRLKNNLKRTGHYVKSSQPENLKLYDTISKKVDQAIRDRSHELKYGIVCFANKDNVLLYVLQVPVENQFDWENKAVTDQWEDLTKQYPSSGVLLLQRNKVSLLDTQLGDLTGETHYEFNLENEDWTQYKGLAYEGITSSSANHRDQYNKRVKVNEERWMKTLVPKLEKHMKDNNWEGVYLAGATELVKRIEPKINKEIFGVVTSNYAGKSANDILTKIIT